jgi:hypothetical protein
MAAHARDILNFKYCRDTNGGLRERAEEIIKAVKSYLVLLNKIDINYCVFPSSVNISYVLSFEKLKMII